MLLRGRCAAGCRCTRMLKEPKRGRVGAGRRRPAGHRGVGPRRRVHAKSVETDVAPSQRRRLLPCRSRMLLGMSTRGEAGPWIEHPWLVASTATAVTAAATSVCWGSRGRQCCSSGRRVCACRQGHQNRGRPQRTRPRRMHSLAWEGARGGCCSRLPRVRWRRRSWHPSCAASPQGQGPSVSGH
jgi:hypothetical protein